MPEELVFVHCRRRHRDDCRTNCLRYGRCFLSTNHYFFRSKKNAGCFYKRLRMNFFVPTTTTTTTKAVFLLAITLLQLLSVVVITNIISSTTTTTTTTTTTPQGTIYYCSSSVCTFVGATETYTITTFHKRRQQQRRHHHRRQRRRSRRLYQYHEQQQQQQQKQEQEQEQEQEKEQLQQFQQLQNEKQQQEQVKPPIQRDLQQQSLPYPRSRTVDSSQNQRFLLISNSTIIINNNNNIKRTNSNDDLINSMPGSLVGAGKGMIRDQLKDEIINNSKKVNNSNNNNNNNNTINNNKNNNSQQQQNTNQKQDQQQPQKQKQHRTVVVHVGPHKTGTTTIQARIRRTMSELYQDGYMIPGDYTNKSSVNMMSLTNCFLPKFNYTFSYYNNNNINNNNNNNNDIANQIKTRMKQIKININNYDNLLLRKRNRERKRRLLIRELQQQNTSQKKTTSQSNNVNKKMHDYSCNPNFLEDIRAIATTGTYDMILTAESFSFDVLIMERIQELLRPWDNVSVIVYYRRFYEWLFSLWNQTFKEIDKNRPTFVEWIKDIPTIEHHSNNNYITGLVPRWEKYFPNSVKLLNIHDLPYYGIVETFFCYALVHANQSCTRVREVISEHGEGHANPSRSFIYKDLTIAATTLQLLSTNATSNITHVIQSARYYQENVLNLTQYDFPKQYRICPSTDILDILLQTTLQTEKQYFYKFYNTMNGEQMIRTQFEHDKETKLCHIDAMSFLQNNSTWIQFFKSL